jgi:hypothetical protein
MMSNVNEYIDILYLHEELLQLNEIDLSAAIRKLTPESKTKNMVKNIATSLDKKDKSKSLKKIKTIVTAVPKVKPQSIDNHISSKYSDYKKMKKTADVVLKNSLPEVSIKVRDIASTFLSVSSMVAKKKNLNIEPTTNLKNNIKLFVTKVRSFVDFDEDEQEKKKSGLEKEDIADLSVAWVIVTMSTALAVGLGTGMYGVLTAIAALFTVPNLIIAGFFIMILSAVLAGIKILPDVLAGG